LTAGSSVKVFVPFRLDTLNQCLWRRRDTGPEERILLSPKTFFVLAYLVENAGRLVTHAELLGAVWSDSVVEPQAVKRHILTVRSALGDRPKHSLFVETVAKRGYRFIAPVSERSALERPTTSDRLSQDLVGRGDVLKMLRETWQCALNGERQIIFITGEPGIGKTALAEVFQRRVVFGEQSIRIAHGQCIEGYGSKEAYGPVLDALGRLCRGPQAEPLVEILSAEAPTWLAQLPGLLTRERREMLQQEISGATRERMVRELGDALESITAETALLLFLEDLQWIDDSTVDLISALARRRTPAKLMLLATYRPLGSPRHSLKALISDLLVRRWCREIDLTPLSQADVEDYLNAQLPTSPPPPGLSALVHRHSEGNPLFMVAALDDMAKRNLVTRANGQWQLQVQLEQIVVEVPDHLRHMIEAQLERLSELEQSALELASIAGASFSVSIISSASDIDSSRLENLYEELSRRHNIVKWAGTQSHPDGSVTERYEFVHVLYRQVLYDRLSPGRRAKLHRRIMLARALELVNHLPEAERPRAEPQPGARILPAALCGEAI
jgi:predicted ATPase/DNA-binding winged helix-turn-helix (wHTH) protein